MNGNMKEYREHPIFGRLTDPEDIMVFDRQQARGDFDKAQQRAYEEAMEEEYQKQCQKEAELFDHLFPIIQHFELTRAFWSAEDLAKEAHCSVEEAEHVIKSLNI